MYEEYGLCSFNSHKEGETPVSFVALRAAQLEIPKKHPESDTVAPDLGCFTAYLTTSQRPVQIRFTENYKLSILQILQRQSGRREKNSLQKG